jgi:hypothetical protein
MIIKMAREGIITAYPFSGNKRKNLQIQAVRSSRRHGSPSPAEQSHGQRPR